MRTDARSIGDTEPLQLRKKRSRPELERHQWFDPWKVAKGAAAKALVDATVGFIQQHEEHTKARVRARRSGNEMQHLNRVEAVVCNLAHAVLLPPQTGYIAIKLGHSRKGRSRYESPILGKPLSPLISTLWDLDLLSMKGGPVIRGEVSSMAPSAWFARMVGEYGVQLSEFGRHEDEEVVLLNRNSRTVIGRAGAAVRGVHREPIDYSDTPATNACRDAVRSINRILSAAAIDFLDDGQEPRIDPYERTLKRRFVILPGQKPGFDQSGRLYGGFWQNLKSERRQQIRIGGEEVGILDYGSMFTRLAYASVGVEPPPGDLYAIPGLESYRSGVKLAMNCFLFDRASRSSWPAALGVGVGDDQQAAADPGGASAQFEGRLPKGWTVARTKVAILGIHPALKPAWGRQLGYRLMFEESEILLAVLQELASRRVPALPLHDGVLIAQSRMELGKSVMVEMARAVAGISIPVTEECYSPTSAAANVMEA